MGNMADDELLCECECDHKVSSLGYMFSKIKIRDLINLDFKDDVVNMLPSDPFDMNISTSSSSSDCAIVSGFIPEEIGLDGVGGDESAGLPNDGLFFALGYLETEDLLCVEGVCKSLCEGVRNDPLLWRNIHVDEPSSVLFTDETLLRLTSRANGSLESLNLAQCNSITNNGLRQVFQQNPGITKLSVLTCNGMTLEGLLSNLKYLKSTVGNGIERLRIGTLWYVTMEQYEDLKKILSKDNNQKPFSNPKPRFFSGDLKRLPLDDDRSIDIDLCPGCHQLKQVFDCPEEKCAREPNYCKGCTFCIPRCVNCGCCFDERDYTETFSLDFICLECITQLLSLPDRYEEFLSITGFHRRAGYENLFTARR